MAVNGGEAITKSNSFGAVTSTNPREINDAWELFPSSEGVSFRPIAASDMDEIMAIERASFDYPWSSRFFLQELQVSCSRSVLAEVSGRIVGYVLFWLLADTVDVHNIAVRKDFRRRGIARRLLQQVVSEGQRRSIVRVTLEVRKSNISAQKLYESFGFFVTGVRKGYYLDDGEDAITMALKLAP